MTSIEMVLKSMRQSKWYPTTPIDYVERYIQTGDPADIKALRKLPHQGMYPLLEGLRPLTQWQQDDRRLVQVLSCLDMVESVLQHVSKDLESEPAGEDYLFRVLEEMGNVPADQMAECLLTSVSVFCHAGGATSAGHFLLACKESNLKRILKKVRRHTNLQGLTVLLCRHAPARVPRVQEELLKHLRWEGPPIGVCRALLQEGGVKYVSRIQRLMQQEKELIHRFKCAQLLYDHAPSRFKAVARTAAEVCVNSRSENIDISAAGVWLVEHIGKEALATLCAGMKRCDSNSGSRSTIMEAAVKAMGDDALPLVQAGLESDSDTRLASVKMLMTRHAVAGLEDRLQEIIADGLANGDMGQQVAYMGLASKWGLARVQSGLWEMLTEGRGEKQIRAAAIGALASLGDSAVPQAIQLLASKNTPARIDAAGILMGIGTEAAAAALESRLEVETNEDVRDATLRGLEQAWSKQGRVFTRADVTARRERMAAKLKAPVAAWLKEDQLPALQWQDGAPVTPQEMRYLLHRQARAREMVADVEAKAAYALLNRATTPAFVLGLLQQFVDAKAESSDRWVLAMAALLGDDRIVPQMVGLIKQWVADKRPRLAEAAVEALGLRGSDAALLAVETLITRYRSKMNKVARAAQGAFEEAALRRQVTPEELGDRVVPWLGFAPGKHWVVSTPKGDVEVAIGPDLKLNYFTLGNSTPMASLPRGIAPVAAAEVKEAAVTLREIAKSQTLRLQNLLVQQRRWPVPRWRELFLGHPVLAALAPRLVWGHYDTAGKLRATFRPLPDRSLTDAADEAFVLPDTDSVGLVHPLEIDAPSRLAWQSHLADFEITPLFPQLHRPVISVTPAQRPLTRLGHPHAAPVNAWAFRSRAESLAWRRGSIGYGGMIMSCWKSFATAGVDAILRVNGLYFGVGTDAEVTLDDLVFVTAGSVGFADYGGQEPQGNDDRRLIPLGQIPPIVFSETMADVAKIAGLETAHDSD